MFQLKHKTGQLSLKYDQNQSTRHNSIKQLPKIDTNYNSSCITLLSPSFQQRQKELLLSLSNLQNENKSISASLQKMNESQHQLQRFRHLLSIKQRVIESQQQELEQIKKQLQAFKRKYAKQLKGKALQLTILDEDVDELSRIDHFQSSHIEEQKENKGFDTRRKICLKKNLNKNSKIFTKGICDDELAATAKMNTVNQQQLMHLRNCVLQLKLQISMLRIQKDHWEKETQLITKRQTKLKSKYNCLLYQQGDKKSIQNIPLNRKMQTQNNIQQEQINCSQAQKLNLNHYNNFSLQKNHQNPPITPHFSNASFIFPHFKKTPTKDQRTNIYDQIFETQSESTEQDYFQGQ